MLEQCALLPAYCALCEVIHARAKEEGLPGGKKGRERGEHLDVIPSGQSLSVHTTMHVPAAV